VPPLIAIKYDLWYFDETSGRILLLKVPTTTPYYQVVVYNLGSHFYCILYKSDFYHKITGWYPNKHQQFVSFYYTSNMQVQNIFLYDVTKGSFSGQLSIPTSGPCCFVEIDLSLQIGFKEKTAVFCRRLGRFKVTLYDLVESNETVGSLWSSKTVLTTANNHQWR
jgi:hypothetical protein